MRNPTHAVIAASVLFSAATYEYIFKVTQVRNLTYAIIAARALITAARSRHVFKLTQRISHAAVSAASVLLREATEFADVFWRYCF